MQLLIWHYPISFCIISWLLETYLGICCQCLDPKMFSSHNFKVLGLILWSLIHFYRVGDRDQVSVFYMEISRFLNTIHTECCLFSLFFGTFAKKSDGCSSVGLLLDLSIYTTGIHVCFCDDKMLFCYYASLV
jgi:hypothetical protein